MQNINLDYVESMSNTEEEKKASLKPLTNNSKTKYEGKKVDILSVFADKKLSLSNKIIELMKVSSLSYEVLAGVRVKYSKCLQLIIPGGFSKTLINQGYFSDSQDNNLLNLHGLNLQIPLCINDTNSELKLLIQVKYYNLTGLIDQAIQERTGIMCFSGCKYNYPINQSFKLNLEMLLGVFNLAGPSSTNVGLGQMLGTIFSLSGKFAHVWLSCNFGISYIDIFDYCIGLTNIWIKTRMTQTPRKSVSYFTQKFGINLKELYVKLRKLSS